MAAPSAVLIISSVSFLRFIFQLWPVKMKERNTKNPSSNENKRGRNFDKKNLETTTVWDIWVPSLTITNAEMAWDQRDQKIACRQRITPAPSVKARYAIQRAIRGWLPALASRVVGKKIGNQSDGWSADIDGQPATFDEHRQPTRHVGGLVRCRCAPTCPWFLLDLIFIYQFRLFFTSR